MIARLKQWVAEPTITPFMVKAFVVTAVAAAFIVPMAIVAIPYIEFFNDMAVQYKVKPQMAWTRSEPGGQVVPGDRESVAGTIPRDYYPYPYADAGPDGAVFAGEQLTSDNALLPGPYQPPEPSMARLERGQKLFETFCITCHGPYGLGDGEVAKRGFPAPPSLLDPLARAYSLGHLFHVQTVGQNVMPSYAEQLSAEDRWAVAYYIWALHKAFPAPAGPPADELSDGGAGNDGSGDEGTGSDSGPNPQNDDGAPNGQPPEDQPNGDR